MRRYSSQLWQLSQTIGHSRVTGDICWSSFASATSGSRSGKHWRKRSSPWADVRKCWKGWPRGMSNPRSAIWHGFLLTWRVPVPRCLTENQWWILMSREPRESGSRQCCGRMVKSPSARLPSRTCRIALGLLLGSGTALTASRFRTLTWLLSIVPH